MKVKWVCQKPGRHLCVVNGDRIGGVVYRGDHGWVWQSFIGVEVWPFRKFAEAKSYARTQLPIDTMLATIQIQARRMPAYEGVRK